jgi:hypothetical protein
MIAAAPVAALRIAAVCCAVRWRHRHRSAEIAKRIDIYATAISYRATVADVTDLDLSYTPPPGSPWDAVQIAATAWHRAIMEQP